MVCECDYLGPEGSGESCDIFTVEGGVCLWSG